METMNYKLHYLPLFYDDLEQRVIYISETLHNPQAANDLLDAAFSIIKKTGNHYFNFFLFPY